MNNDTPGRLTVSDWSIVADAIPGFESLDRSLVEAHAEVLSVPGGSILAPDGMYVVLDGNVALKLRGDEIAKAGTADYFYEEHLAIDALTTGLTAETLTTSRLLFVSRANWTALPDDSRNRLLRLLFGDLVNVHLHEFQQPINCCNITAVALSITALGYACDVNDIFKSCALPVSYVVDDGMTIGELYDVASSYVFAKGLRDQIGVELYYFDQAAMTRQDLVNAIAESDRVGGDKDILVANFGVSIAHGNPELRGGHFALIAKCNQSTGLVHVMDVHPQKYGKIWVTSIDRLYEAMSEPDASSMRSRGLLRFIVKKEIGDRLHALAKSDCYPVNCTVYLDLTPEKRRHIFSRSTVNLNSLHVLAMGISLLDNRAVAVDDILDAASLSYSDALTLETTPERLATFANEYLTRSGLMTVGCTCRSFDDSDETSADAWFKSQLLSIATDPGRCFIINIDYNEVVGFEAIHRHASVYRETARLEEYWCICIDYLYESDVVILADISSATSQIWRAPRHKLFAGLRAREAPRIVYLEEIEEAANPNDFDRVIADHPLVLFYNEEDPWSYMLKSVLENIGATELHLVDVSGFDLAAIHLRKKLAVRSGKDKTPYLYFEGNCLGEVDDIMTMVRNGSLQTMLDRAGLPVLMRNETPSLDRNMFSYPKGGLTAPRDGRYNVLLCCCGSSAADKIPELVDLLTEAGHNVKLVPTSSSETFFKDIGMQRILGRLRPSDIYRDDDEWNFRYTEFNMPVRAAHLALCDWADCVVVAPVTCNTMGKIAHGVADNLLSSLFVAWEYHRKPVILCPACNTNMWNNLTTQNNVAMLKRLGCRIEGPRSGILSNGRMGTGMMAHPAEIMDALAEAFAGLDDHAKTVMRWGRAAAESDDPLEWRRIYRAIDEGVVGVNILDDENGDSLLHYAAGGEGKVTETGIERGVPDLEPMRELISRGADVDLRNDYSFSPMHVAMMNDSLEAVNILLEAGAGISHTLNFMNEADISDAIRQRLLTWARDHGIEPAKEATHTPFERHGNQEGELYFTYGSLKRDFPNHAAHADVLDDYVGEAETRQMFPLVVPIEPSCTNPNCPYLHRMAALVEVRGMGHRVRGEVYRVRSGNLSRLDELEGFLGDKMEGNVYVRKRITVMLEDEICEAFTYFIADARTQLDALEAGTAEMVTDYTLDMAVGPLKPGFTAPTGQ